MSEGLSLLLETKTQQYKKVRAETQMLLDTVKIKRRNIANQLKRPQFVMIPQRRVPKIISTAIAQTQLCMDVCLSWNNFSQEIFNEFSGSMEIAWARNVKTRFIIQSPPESEAAKQIVHSCREKPSCQIKFLRDFPRTSFRILDKKELFLVVEPETYLQCSPELWSKNLSLVALAQECFELLWPKATESINETH
jgi:hypothetical protein